jgi:hypothetical protein
MSKRDALVLLDLNNPTFQETLFALPKPERHSAVDTLKKIRRLSWPQLYADRGLKWEKITSVTPPAGIDAVYYLRLSQSRRATAHRDGEYLRFLTVTPDHDATYGKK